MKRQREKEEREGGEGSNEERKRETERGGEEGGKSFSLPDSFIHQILCLPGLNVIFTV